MLVGIAAVVLAVLGENGGLGNSFDLLGDISDANGDKGAYSSLFGPDPINLAGVVILTSLGTWGLPQMVQKAGAYPLRYQLAFGTCLSRSL